MQKISGALNPFKDDVDEHTFKVYESIRKRSGDIYFISKNTNFTYEQVSLIKGHLFFNRHVLDGEVDRFYPSYEISESWRRLSSKTGKGIQPHDILLLHHELLEISYIMRGYSQQDAHHMASLRYDYSKASNEYYKSLGF